MKKCLALVMVFILTMILSAAAEDIGNLLNLFGISSEEGEAQSMVGTIPSGDINLSLD